MYANKMLLSPAQDFAWLVWCHRGQTSFRFLFPPRITLQIVTTRVMLWKNIYQLRLQEMHEIFSLVYLLLLFPVLFWGFSYLVSRPALHFLFWLSAPPWLASPAYCYPSTPCVFKSMSSLLSLPVRVPLHAFVWAFSLFLAVFPVFWV